MYGFSIAWVAQNLKSTPEKGERRFQMLILTRRKNEAIRLGNDTRIILVDIKGGQVRIGIECPPHVRVVREEVFQIEIHQRP